MQAAPLATVVVVTWNGRHLLEPCLAALKAQTLGSSRFQVWVVDNGSEDGTVEWLADQHRWLRLVALPENTGFAGGCNAALREVDTPYAVLVNNDAIVAPDFLEQILSPFDEPGGEDLAAVTGRVLLTGTWQLAPADRESEAVLAADGRRYVPAVSQRKHDPQVVLVNSTGNEVRRDGNGQDRGWLTIDGADSPDRAVFGFCGAAAALRMKAVREVGYFADEFFLYYEDTDLSWRLRRRGWRVEYQHSAVARHAHSSSSREGSPLFRHYNERNRLLVLTRNAPLRVLLGVLARYTALTVVLLAGHPRRAVARLSVLNAWCRRLPRAMADRRAIDRSARCSRASVARLLVAAPRGRGRGPGPLRAG